MIAHKFTLEQMRAWSDLIVNARKSRGLKQTEVAEESGVNVPTLASLERAPYANMRFLDLVHLGKFYGISPTHFAQVLGLWPDDATSPQPATLPDDIQALIASLPEDRQALAKSMIRNVLKTLAEE